MKKAFTIIEVVIFVAIVSIFFIYVIQLSTSSLSAMKSGERKTYATRYAEELTEWLFAEKENDWDNTFLPKAPLTTATVYCFNSAITTWPAAGSCAGFTLNSFFKREVAMSRQANTAPGDYQVTAIVTVSWVEGSGTQSVTVKSVFNKYE